MTPRAIKRILVDINGVVCTLCCRRLWTAPNGESVEIPLVLDHIDGNHENNRVDNLRLVCGNCDMLLPTYKSKNIGNGRHRRRQRRSDGKSF
ncbi:MAG: HNH endonuclease [Nitrospira sp.]